MNTTHSERERQRDQYNRAELVERLQRAMPTDGKIEPVKGLVLIRSSHPTEPIHGVAEPSLCVIAQGSKEILLGEACFHYDAYSYLLATVELPVTGRVLEASAEAPYLALGLALDPAVVGSVLVELNQPPPHNQGDVKGMVVSPLEAPLLEVVLRLVRLLDSAADMHLLMPLIKKEIIYRLLVGSQGHRLPQMTALSGHTHRVAQAIHQIRKHFDQTLPIRDLASQVGMSVSGFHHHFKEVTTMSPLQYQKQLRLQEARRLMLGEHFDAARAGYQVGYEDPSHFNRDYKRLFGVPPLRDVERLRETESKGSDSIDFVPPTHFMVRSTGSLA